MARIPAADALEEIRQEGRSAAAWHHVGILASPYQHVLLQPGYLAAECRQPAAHLHGACHILWLCADEDPQYLGARYHALSE